MGKYCIKGEKVSHTKENMKMECAYMDIYIKPEQKVQMVKRKEVYIKDIAAVYINGQTAGELENLPVFQIKEEKQRLYLLSMIDVIAAINKRYPEASVSNLGQGDILLEYLPSEKKANKMQIWGKVLFVAAVLFCGSATTIMCFHSDTQLPKIFQNYYYLFFGENKDVPLLMTIPYSFGLVTGILFFFNHFSKFFISNDPTPIEVQMTTYENETVTSMVENLNQKKREVQNK